MTPDTFAFAKLFEFVGALSVLTGSMAWWRRDTPEEDDMTAAAADVVLDAVSDGDMVERINCIHHRNLRDQISVQEAIELDSERTLRRWQWRN